MGINISEYVGQRTDRKKAICPIGRSVPKCAFANIQCPKAISGNKPVCSVKRKGDLWIVCPHRLCSSKGTTLTPHQKSILLSISKEIFGSHTRNTQIVYKKEVPLPIAGTKSKYRADYILSVKNCKSLRTVPPCLIVEMQGGGETSSTGTLTRHVSTWEHNAHRTNALLAQPLQKVGVIQTNAWRRQQEQLLVKGHIAIQSGMGMVLCVGTILFDYLKNRLNNFQNFPNLRNTRWDFALLAFREKAATKASTGKIELELDPTRTLFTTFHAFSSSLATQGAPVPGAFIGKFRILQNGRTYKRI